MTDPLRWGIMSTGNIADQFAAGVNAGAQHSTLAAVGSRSPDKAQAFAARHQIAHAHPSYDALLADDDVQAVYVALPNALHHQWTLKALNAGKHVLCEKPFATNERQAREMFDLARRRRLTLVEAFMYRSHPLTHAVLAKVRAGAIGRVKLIRVSFCLRATKIRDNCRFSTELAGGALMDIGCYCTSFARLVAGAEPVAVRGYAHLHESGVDDWAAGVLRFADDTLATFTCAMTAQADNTASICGEHGYIEIPVPWKPPTKQATFMLGHSAPPLMDKPTHPTPPPRQTFHVDADKPLYALEADDFAATVRDGIPPAVTEADTLGNMRVLDQLRQQAGLPF